MSRASGDNAELIRRAYDAWNRGDVEAIAAVLDENVELHAHPRLPEPGPYIGRDQVKSWLLSLHGAWESIVIDSLAVAESGDSVVALVHIAGRGRGSGVDVQSGIDAHIWKLEGGRVAEMRWIQGDEVAKRLGLPSSEVQSVGDDALAKLPQLAGPPSA